MTATVARWTAGPLPAAVEQALARLVEAEDVRRIAVMPDVHLADAVCIGTVVATSHLLYPAAVGGDIGCGMAALGFDCAAEAAARPAVAARLLEGLARAVPVRRRAGARHDPLPGDLEARTLGDPRLDRLARGDGRAELATLGSGNHFVELQSDPEGRLWLMLHSGSRAIGPAIRDSYLGVATAGAAGGWLEADSEVGQRYLAAVAWARDWAAASRRIMAERVTDLLGRELGARADQATWLTCDHNHVAREEHGGEALWVHRKGAIRAGAGEPGIIPGSMGAPSFHVVGRGEPAALYSSSHGAGRALSRGDARRAVSAAGLRREMRGVWFDWRLAARLTDEAPSAYKDIGEVMRAQHPLTRVVRSLVPILAFKGA